MNPLPLFLRLADYALRTRFSDELAQWKSFDRLPLETLLKIQQERLARLLSFAQQNNAFYRSFLNPRNLHLRDLPVIGKKEILDAAAQMVSNGFAAEKLVTECSSGSSGLRTEVKMTRAESFATIAAQTHLWSWAGYFPGKKIVQLGMNPARGALKRCKDLAFRTLYLPAFELSPDRVDAHLQKMQQFRGCVFGGYASGLFTHAQRALSNRISDIHFDSVISWGDKLFPHYREALEQAFHAKVFDTYGATEGFVIAGQCEYGRYHTLIPHVLLELLDSNGNEVAEGETGRVVATRLDAFAQPLIRYSLGDLAVKAPARPCPCGRAYPVIEKIIGRDTDIVTTPGDRKLIVHFFTGIFEHVPAIEQFRVVQKSPHAVEIEVIHNLRPEDWKVTAGRLRSILWEKAGERFPFEFRRVDRIPSTPSGKPQIVTSSVPF